MKTTSKLFGGSHILHLTCHHEKQEILDHVFAYTGVKIPEKKQPLKLLGTHNFQMLKKGYYCLAVPDDLSMFIFFTKYKGRNTCFMICRQINPGYTLPKILVVFPEILNVNIYQGTLLETTRIRATDHRFFILVTDVCQFNGTKIINENFIHRLLTIGEFMENCFKENLAKFPFRIQIVTPYEHLSLVETRINNLPYKVDRLIFQPQNRKDDSLYYPL
jgi:hypothetical protein